FSALDYRTDAILRRRLKEVTQDATVLIVAQRVGTIMDADQIIVLDKGEIVGRGRHEELMETNDIYREIAESQLKNASLTEE
ncbi:MAG: Multidrug resistance ABC superfamily ATP binding cassette transporter, ABC/membrane protein, partial [Streptococcus parasanguinis DORA_23_24]